MRDNIAVCYVVCVLPRRRCPHAFVLHAVGRTTNSNGFLGIALSLARHVCVRLAAARVGHLPSPLSCCGESFALLWATFAIRSTQVVRFLKRQRRARRASKRRNRSGKAGLLREIGVRACASDACG